MENASHADTGTGERSEEHGPRGRRVRESEVIIMGVQRLSCRQRGAGKDPRETPNTERREKSSSLVMWLGSWPAYIKDLSRFVFLDHLQIYILYVMGHQLWVRIRNTVTAKNDKWTVLLTVLNMDKTKDPQQSPQQCYQLHHADHTLWLLWANCVSNLNLLCNNANTWPISRKYTKYNKDWWECLFLQVFIQNWELNYHGVISVVPEGFTKAYTNPLGRCWLTKLHMSNSWWHLRKSQVISKVIKECMTMFCFSY